MRFEHKEFRLLHCYKKSKVQILCPPVPVGAVSATHSISPKILLTRTPADEFGKHLKRNKSSRVDLWNQLDHLSMSDYLSVWNLNLNRLRHVSVTNSGRKVMRGYKNKLSSSKCSFKITFLLQSSQVKGCLKGTRSKKQREGENV